MMRPLLVLLLCVGCTHAVWADCAAQCSACTVEGPDVDLRINPLICSLECEGSLRSSVEWGKCQRILNALKPPLSESDKQAEASMDASREGEKVTEDQPADVNKRYGGFMKKLEKSKAFANAVQRENSVMGKGGSAKKYGGFQRKFGERETPDEEPAVRNSEEIVDYLDSPEIGLPKDEMKRYGGFLRKYPKRSTESLEEEEHLHKRYGGFMRRIRPKLKWDNEKRYGGILRRQFKITARADVDPNTFSAEIADL